MSEPAGIAPVPPIQRAAAGGRAKFTALLVGPLGIGLLANLGIYNTLAVDIGSAVDGQRAMRAMAAARARREDQRLPRPWPRP